MPHLINLAFGHRGITHRFIFFLGFLFTSLTLNIVYEEHPLHFEIVLIAFAFSFGILFHQLGDMLAGSKRYKGGIKAYLYPFTNDYNKYSTPFPFVLRCAVNSAKEHLYLFFFTGLVVYEFYLILASRILNRFN